MHVYKLQSALGASTGHFSKIAEAFWDYYAQLYNLPDTMLGRGAHLKWSHDLIMAIVGTIRLCDA